MTSRRIDLRSDTVTKPTPGMRKAIAGAEVGDDMVGEDPTVNQLEEKICDLLGKPAAVYACSGTQSNQMAVRAHCQSGDELLIEETGHIANWEAGGPAVMSGVTVRTVRGDHGLIDVADLEGKVRPDNQHYCATKLVCIENTTNHGGGRVYPLTQVARIRKWTADNFLQLHADGARLFNACIAGNYSASAFAGLVDSVSICFSKGLGCPMGSILVGEVDVIQRARRARKLFGGALRQAGMMAAAAIYALDHHVERLAEDHANARRFAEQLAEIPGVVIDPSVIASNLVFFEIEPGYGTAAEVAARLKDQGVILYATGPQRIRACTHLDVTAEELSVAAQTLEQVLNGAATQVAVTADVAY
ncbi:aminotransferase class I/II-fold pyridoxal phosphate-dependent enzyme [bacterium]|nr:aminotransferase class I/II-fold pyridoxal phosphate-dependent enzyme [bacterium]